MNPIGKQTSLQTHEVNGITVHVKRNKDTVVQYTITFYNYSRNRNMDIKKKRGKINRFF
jgi:hypothetical protein